MQGHTAMQIDHLLQYFTEYCERIQRHARVQCVHAVHDAHQMECGKDQQFVVVETFGDKAAATAIVEWSKRLLSQFIGFCPRVEELPNEADRRRALDILSSQLQSLAQAVDAARCETVRVLIDGEAKPKPASLGPLPMGPATTEAAMEARTCTLREARMLLRL